jgi:hypothetical protein
MTVSCVSSPNFCNGLCNCNLSLFKQVFIHSQRLPVKRSHSLTATVCHACLYLTFGITFIGHLVTEQCILCPIISACLLTVFTFTLLLFICMPLLCLPAVGYLTSSHLNFSEESYCHPYITFVQPLTICI